MKTKTKKIRKIIIIKKILSTNTDIDQYQILINQDLTLTLLIKITKKSTDIKINLKSIKKLKRKIKKISIKNQINKKLNSKNKNLYLTTKKEKTNFKRENFLLILYPIKIKILIKKISRKNKMI